MSKEVSIDTVKLNRLMDKVRGVPDKLFRKKTMKVIGLIHKNRIFLRTLSGKDTEGNKFKPYSANYALSAKKLSVNNVNLSLTGMMLKGMNTTATDNSARIFFSTDENNDLAAKHENGDGVPKRSFFGISDEDSENIFKDYSKVTNKLLKKAGFE